MQFALALPAPAKLNLFLHVTGRRADGYHDLQTAYTLIDLADWLDFERRDDGVIVREGDLVGVKDRDLAVRAAHALKNAAGASLGVTIGVTKRIPAGSGLGGGSSDAATTLIALNRLWGVNLKRSELAAIGLQLGADIPFFLHGRDAFAEGIGERLTTIELPPLWLAIVWPGIHVSTREIFGDAGLTRNSKATKIADFSALAAGWAKAPTGNFELPSSLVNDLEPVARRRFPVIDEAIKRLERFGAARMTGSGSAVFLAARSREQAELAVADLPAGWSGWVARKLVEHPLAVW
ncbi:MAG TPA: 4-(cytidine 5'-diphospho)-2-C-methyl-D-erythritol kinase [Burkholderiaceae bacterium]|nr:4-(cytidine 5'-diphospho)-2-C-methyl-D-erythritol kinase [Burkholderiaceae bacterium]